MKILNPFEVMFDGILSSDTVLAYEIESQVQLQQGLPLIDFLDATPEFEYKTNGMTGTKNIVTSKTTVNQYSITVQRGTATIVIPATLFVGIVGGHPVHRPPTH